MKIFKFSKCLKCRIFHNLKLNLNNCVVRQNYQTISVMIKTEQNYQHQMNLFMIDLFKQVNISSLQFIYSISTFCVTSLKSSQVKPSSSVSLYSSKFSCKKHLDDNQ
ncbi:hypothetical protein BLOT_010193 [Blomia tropicalis]|nr:hypothetical protein BLOT_010193 [Blomia tropicalis]